ncbi:MAG: SDR family oxidoreductase [Proteobacteria bacterium]|nr:SDR family oxidoreductase [Pseudomonadota bacterium]
MRIRDQDIVIITGASRGIGKAAAIEFGKKKCRVDILARDSSKLNEVKTQIESAGGQAMVVNCDVSNENDCFSAIEQVINTWGSVDILVNNAGYGHYGNIENLDTPGMEKIIRTNLFGPIWCTKAVLPTMKKNQRGHIVNISTIISKRAFPHMGAYCMSKFALTGMDESLGLELKKYGVGVSLVCPGYTATEFQQNAALSGQRPDLRQKLGMKPETVGKAIVKAVECNIRRTTLTLDGKFLLLMNKISPSFVDYIFSKMFKEKNDAHHTS